MVDYNEDYHTGFGMVFTGDRTSAGTSRRRRTCFWRCRSLVGITGRPVTFLLGL